MPTSGHPVAANDDGDQIVELQSHDGRATNRRLAEDACAVIAPDKMLRPTLAARIEQRHQLPRDGVTALGLSGLGVVAQPAREPKIVFLVCAATGRRLEMVNLHNADQPPAGLGRGGRPEYVRSSRQHRPPQPTSNGLAQSLRLANQSLLIDLHQRGQFRLLLDEQCLGLLPVEKFR